VNRAGGPGRAAGQTAGRGRGLVTATAGESRWTVIVALAINLLIAVAKTMAALLTGSSSLFAEAAHSVADSGNEALLLIALRRSSRPADETHPFGYGAERFYWSLLAAIGIFVAGGVTAIYEGIRHLNQPEPLVAPLVAYGVLVISLALEATSWTTAFRQLRGEARGRRLSLGTYLRRTTDPTATTVFYEDSAAVIGIFFALAGVALHQVTQSAVPDAAASIAIGLLLVVVAVRLASRERELLTNQSASRAVVGAVRGALESAPEVESVPRLEVMIIGPRAALVTAEVRLADEPSGERVAQVLAGLRDLVREQPLIAEVYLTPVGVPRSGGPR
jgi:cation diffusion facilitator family transporter